jgi:enoyl-CoA hydratase
MNETVKPVAERRAEDGAAKAIDGAPLASKVEVSRTGALVTLTLNRPAALNAFDDEMRAVVAGEITRMARNADIYVVVLTSASPKAFCAGGDVRAIVAGAQCDKTQARGYFRGEYNLNWQLDCFSKPVVSFIDGLCMGSGAGLTLYNTHRVAGEGYKFAMPETAIGLFPDVGVSHRLAQLPWPMGLYLGLTGRMIERADAYWLGLATHCIDREHFAKIYEKLSEAEPIDPLLDDLHQAPGAGPLQVERAVIEDLFSVGTLPEIMRGMERATGAGAAFAKATLADLKKRSPLALLITDRHIRNAQSMDLRQTLIGDYRLAMRCLDGKDFYEGVRAALIDKDGAPRWQHSSIEAVTESELAAYFAPLSGGELELPTRTEMQAART